MGFEDELTLSQVRLMGDPVLTSRCREVEDFGERAAAVEAQLIDGLRRERNGIGLAANQIGLRVRAFSYDLRGSAADAGGSGGAGAGGMRDAHGVAFNPVIVEGDGGSFFNEGCLSVPGLYWDVFRPERIHVKFFSVDGEERDVELDGLAARLFQHEVDHLDGLLIFDRIDDPAEKREALRQAAVLLDEQRNGLVLP